MDPAQSVFLPSALAVDVEEIDDQHAALFQRLAHLKHACIESNGVPENEAEALIEALQVHFMTEGRLARAAGMDFAEHAVKHRTMLASIVRMMDRVRAGETDIFSLIKFIEYWFERHILDEDKPLGHNLQQLGFTRFGEQFSESPADPPKR